MQNNQLDKKSVVHLKLILNAEIMQDFAFIWAKKKILVTYSSP